jgi:NHLM bacteriocin system ABC transporter ATP-binding protein
MINCCDSDVAALEYSLILRRDRLINNKVLMKDLSGSEFTERRLKSNGQVVLTDDNHLWWLKSGAIAVFAVEKNLEIGTGERRYLFDLESESVLFALSSQQHLTEALLAVPYEDTTVLVIDYAAENLDAEQLKAWLEQWSDRLNAVFMGTDITLPKWDWVTGESIQEKLEILHRYFQDGLRQLRELETQINQKRFQERLRLSQQVSQQVIGDLTSVFWRKNQNNSKDRDLIFSQIVNPLENPLLRAVAAIAQVQGITVQTPANSVIRQVGNPLEVIANASRLRIRRVTLTGTWWTSDCGAFLAYADEDSRPLAILPKGAAGYEIFDPTRQARFPLTAKTAKLLSRFGYTFYRSFPDQAMTAIAIVKFAFHGKTRDLVTMLTIGLITSVIGMAIPLTTGLLIETIIPEAKRHLLIEMGLCLFAVSFGSTLFTLAQGVTSSRLQTLADVETQSAVWDRLLKLPVTFFREYTIGDLQSRVSAVTQIRRLLSSTVLQTIFSSIFASLNLGLMLFYSPSLTLVAIAMTVLLIIVTNIVSLQTQKKIKPLQEMQGYLNGLTVQLISGVPKLRVAGAEKRAFAFWSKKFSEMLKLSLSTEVIEDGMVLFLSVLSIANPVILFSLAATQFTSSSTTNGVTAIGLSTGAFLAFNSAYGLFFGGATNLGSIIVPLMSISILWERARPIVESLPEVTDDKIDPSELSGSISIDRLSFRYHSNRPLIIENLSLEIKSGEFVAIVGASGSGKSTLVSLLLGFEKPESGKIYYDSQDLASLDIAAVRRQLGVVLQNGRIDGSSIMENISGGMPITEAEAWEALELAGFAEEIAAMPMGMQTIISEGGRNLSGGQKQRLLLARAMRMQPKILILDEATSSLDNQTQAKISDSLDRLKVTRIAIAHRLSTVQNADQIYVLESGKIVQQGKFAELINRQGTFADLMANQI